MSRYAKPFSRLLLLPALLLLSLACTSEKPSAGHATPAAPETRATRPPAARRPMLAVSIAGVPRGNSHGKAVTLEAVLHWKPAPPETHDAVYNWLIDGTNAVSTNRHLSLPVRDGAGGLRVTSIRLEVKALRRTAHAYTNLVAVAPAYRPKRARNIVLFIGDGMGTEQVKAANWLAGGFTNRLFFDRLPVQGTIGTREIRGLVTDSAAGGTALATGRKTENTRIATAPDGSPLETILQLAQKQGKAVGLVTDVPVAHATPAVFAAHADSRAEMAEIAVEMLSRRPDVLLGGGEQEFLPRGTRGRHGRSKRRDERNLIREAETAGYHIVYNATELAAAPLDRPLLGLFAMDGMARPFKPSLPEMTVAAIQRLSRNTNGFFLMVEGGQLDWAGHANDARNQLGDTIALDRAIQAAAALLPESDTLLVVTADHETGGLRVLRDPGDEAGGAAQDNPGEAAPADPAYTPRVGRGVIKLLTPDGQPFSLRYTSTQHSAAEVPVRARGPYAELLAGRWENVNVFFAMLCALENRLTAHPLLAP